MPFGSGQPVICVVTDRRRLPPPVDDSLIRLVTAVAAAGVDLIQVRERDLDARGLLTLTCHVRDAAAGRAAVIVNDRTDVALAAGVRGVHLRGDSAETVRVRAIVPRGFLVGRSVHSAAEATVRGAGTDFLIAGTVFHTASKPGLNRPLGPDGLEAVCRAVDRPVLAIGGMTADNIGDIGATGAAGIAAIGIFTDLVTAVCDEHLDARMERLVSALRKRFRRSVPRQ